MKIFARLRFLYAAFVISSVVSGMILLLRLFPKHKGAILHHGNRWMIALLGAKVQSKGAPHKEAQLFLLNHQSIVDIIVLESLCRRHLRWVAKKELFEIPWFGRLLQWGEMIAIDREDRRGLVKLLKDVKVSIEKMHRPVAIFPEGTRAKTQQLLPFKEGAKFIAEKFGLVVQPVVVVGSKWIVNEHEKSAHRGHLHVIYLPPIDVKNAPATWYDDLQRQMQEHIDQAFREYGLAR